jgi:hypothetical protein
MVTGAATEVLRNSGHPPRRCSAGVPCTVIGARASLGDVPVRLLPAPGQAMAGAFARRGWC